jgi:hypothetical protein
LLVHDFEGFSSSQDQQILTILDIHLFGYQSEKDVFSLWTSFKRLELIMDYGGYYISGVVRIFGKTGIVISIL